MQIKKKIDLFLMVATGIQTSVRFKLKIHSVFICSCRSDVNKDC